MILQITMVVVFSFGLGALPLTGWIVQVMTRKDLRQLGTGNVGVSAAFLHGGKGVGILAAWVEALRGLLPVILAVRLGLSPTWQVLSLLPLVLARYGLTGGGGVTNVAWGILMAFPLPSLATAMTAGILWGVTRSRLMSFRIACLSTGLWIWIWTHSIGSGVAMLTVAAVIVAINLLQADDMALATQQANLIPLKQADDPQQVGEKAARLAQLMQAGFRVPMGWVLPPGELTESLRVALGSTIQPNDQQPWIVRSSALGEDSDTSSAAGQYRTLPNITTPEQLVASVQICQDSYEDPEAQRYRQQRQLIDTGMGVLIQQQIQGQISGVAFSRNPLDGRAQVVIEALQGGAEQVVSGQKTPVHLEIPIPKPDPADLPQQELMSPEVLGQLVDQIQQIEAHFHGIPQDVEWTWDGDQIWILQSRPITSLYPIWTRTIAAEVIPGAIPPLTWSINRPLTCGVWGEIFTLVLQEQVQDLDFNQTVTLLGSHAYFNATLLGEIFRQMGLPEQGLEFLLRGQKMGKPPRSAYGQLLKCLPGLLRLIQRERSLPRSFAQDQRETFQPTLQVLDRTPPEELTNGEIIDLIQQLQDTLRQVTFYNIVGPIGLAIRRALLRVQDSWLVDRNSPEIQATQALRELARDLNQQLDPSLALEERQAQFQQLFQAKEIQQRFDRIMADYGFLSEVGTDISVPCWQDQPEAIQQLVQGMAIQSLPDPEPNPPPKLNLWQRWRADRCQERVDLKAQIATVYLKLLAYLRRSFLALEQRWLDSGLLHRSGDIFFLEADQVRELAQSDPATLRTRIANITVEIAERRARLARDKQRPIPPVVYGSLMPEVIPVRDLGDQTLLTGIPASVGVAEGQVKICRSVSLEALQDLGEDRVVVVPYTDAGWAPLLIGSKALVSEVGGQLSHGAIVAREYRIPAVMNVEQALSRLQDGQRVRVDGYRGTVEILESSG